ncbi:hypothetical protein FOZ62_007880, partial [Perkinsus olseni]
DLLINLRSLNLEDNLLTAAGCTELFSVLPHCPALEELAMSSNSVERSLIDLADSLPNLVKLAWLALSDCSLEYDHGFAQLVDRLLDSTSLRAIHLADNRGIGSGGVQDLLQRL